MRLRIHHPLFAGFLGVIGLLVVLITIFVGTGLRRELVEVYQEELHRQLRLAESALVGMGDEHPDVLAGLLGERMGRRVTLVSRDGVVLGDSDVPAADLSTVENHRERPEFLGAKGGEVAFAQRRSATLGRRFLYGARPVVVAGEPVILRIAASLDDIDATVRRSQRAVAVAGLIALVVAYRRSRGLAAPLVSLSRTARAMAAGDFTQRAPAGARVAELDDLASAFNRLTDELQVRLSELGRERDEMRAVIDCLAEGVIALSEEAQVVWCNRAASALLGIPEDPDPAPLDELSMDPELRDVLEEAVTRRVGTREVNVGDRRLIVSARPLDQGGAVATFLDVSEIRRLELVRRDFVANASHELKTPLTALRGWAETLVDDDPPEALRKEIMALIRKNAVRLQLLLDDLLDLSRLESGTWTVHDEMVPLTEVIDETWIDFAERAEKQGVRFSVTGGGSAAADAQGVAQVLRNLFDNALRYTEASGEIRVSVASDGDWVTVAVSDTGIGMPTEALSRIFERFYRIDPARSRAAGGTGLGLAIVRHLVSAMGGEITAESEEGQGTTMRFTLPDWDAPASVMTDVVARRGAAG